MLATLIATLVVLLPQIADGVAAGPSQRVSAQSVRAFKLWARHRVGPRQFRALNKIWTHESGWNRYARNPSSGAYGIPQALPAGKLGRAGADWTWNGYTQMRWGLMYIRSHYGTPARAWRFWLAHSWY
jgi:hypothetical protein